jgi:hypothetical protein
LLLGKATSEPSIRIQARAMASEHQQFSEWL